MSDDIRDRVENLCRHEAGSESPQYYVEHREQQSDVHYCCFGGTTFVLFEDSVSRSTGVPIGTQHLWQRERDGARIEAVPMSETVWSRVRGEEVANVG